MDWQRLVYTWRWNVTVEGLAREPTFRDSSALWLHGKPCPGDYVLTQWKVFQTLVVEGGEPLGPVWSRLDIGGGAAADETADSYPLTGWPLGAGVVGPVTASPVTITQLYGPELAWKDLPRTDVVTLAAHPGCDACIPIPCEDIATLRLLSRPSVPFVGVLETMVVFWIRERRRGNPCS